MHGEVHSLRSWGVVQPPCLGYHRAPKECARSLMMSQDPWEWQRLESSLLLLYGWLLFSVMLGVGVGKATCILTACLKKRHLAWLTPLLHVPSAYTPSPSPH